jgi:hypothetical protein
VIIGNLDIIGFARDQQLVCAHRVFGICPTKADTPLIVDPDAVLTGPIATKRLEPIRWRIAKLNEARHALQLREPLAAWRANT